MHNDEENKQQARAQGDNRDEGRRESPETCNLKLLKISNSKRLLGGI